MRKLCLMSCALALAGLVSFWLGGISRDYPTVEGQARGEVIPKVDIQVLFDGLKDAFSAGVSGLSVEAEVIERLDPETSQTVKVPGRVKFGDITLKRGVMSPSATENVMYEWFQDIKQGRGARKNGSILMLDAVSGAEIARYEFYEGWPCKWKAVRAPNAGAAYPMEEISFVFQKIQKVRTAR